ncbi:MAG: hypothetical protein MK078_03910 [Crocinitomicaceae bacterium]|nr:hypothetical protein [Crocinitomicaceae bacterium]
MKPDLIQRVHWQRSRGEVEPFEDVVIWLGRAEKGKENPFTYNGKQYYWVLLNASELSHIIHDDNNFWIYIFSQEDKFKAIGQVQKFEFPIQKEEPTVYTLWILQSQIPSLQVSKEPINIYCPIQQFSPSNIIEKDFITLLDFLNHDENPITRFVDRQKYNTDTLRVR